MNRRKLGLWALMLVLALAAAACGGGGDTGTATEEPGGDTVTDAATPADGATGAADPTGDDTAVGAEGGEFSVYVGEPESLIPYNTNETEGAEVLNALFSGLVEYELETNAALWGDDAARAAAADITSEDNVTWTITLKEGWTFHDGTPLTAQNYVDGWNFASLSTNAQGNSYFFEIVEGYDDLQAEVDDEGSEVTPPAAEELSGLTAVDDQTIEVVLTGPLSNFPTRLGYTAFYPAHPSLLEDPEAYNEAPIGNGPFQIDGAWEHDQSVRVTRYEDYAGEPAAAEAITFSIYADIATAYNDLLAGNLDVMDSLPPEQLATAEEQFGDRFIETPASSFTYVGFPTYLDEFSDPRVRQAFSMAIDRQPIIDAIFNGSFTPADDLVSPVVDGYREGACGELCTYDPEAAAALLEEAGGIESPITLWFNSGAGHDLWMEAVGTQLQQNLGVEYVFEELQFADYLGRLDNEEITGPFRLGWVMDYPSPENYLKPIHGTDGSSNNTGYSNPEADELITQGDEADTIEEGVEFYQQADDLIIQDMPIIPMWFGLNQGAFSERVEGATVDAFDRINTADITVNA